MTDAAPWINTPARELAARGTVDAFLEAADAVVAEKEADIRAFVNLETMDARRARLALLKVGPFGGLPFGVKDIFDTQELPTEYGSPIYKGYQPGADATCVALMRAAGGALYGKTVTTEYASFQPGKTRNPRNLEHTPGGSSSGSAAAVAAGMLPFALGTQTGGSVIRPAAFCGIVGFKPSYNQIPTPGMKTFAWSLDTIGVFANRVADAGFAAEVLTGRAFNEPVPSSELRIRVCKTPMAEHAQDETMAALDFTAERLSAAGFQVREIDLPEIFVEAHRAHDVLNDREGALSLSHEWHNHRNEISERLQALILNGLSYDIETYDAARLTMKAARLALTRIWNNADIILAPSAPGPAPKGLGTTGDSVFNRLWTAMGVPCVNIPGLIAANGLPLGMQVIGPAMSDAKTLAAAQAVETVLDPGP